jgi:NitT/TauT family transport system substrate-binding protein
MITLAGCSGKPASVAPSEPAETAVKVIALQGVQDFPLIMMEQQGIAKKYKLKLEKQMVVDPQAEYTAMKLPEFQISFGGWPTIALMRSQGYKVTSIYSVMNYSNDILVKKDSPLKSIEDLKGKNIGVFGGPSASTTLFFRMVGSRFFDFDPLKQANVKFGAPPLLAGMLDRGDLDAVLLLDPVSTQLLDSGKYRTIGNIGEIWKQKTGQNPVFLCVVVNEAWAKANPDAVKRFVSAYKESVEYIKSHDDVWSAFAKQLEIKTAEGTELLRKQIDTAMLAEWNKNLIDEQYKSFAEMNKLFPGIEGIPNEIPEGTFSLDYAP